MTRGPVTTRRRLGDRVRSRGARRGLLLVGALFGLICLVFDGLALGQIVAGLDAQWRFVPVPATVLQSEVTTRSSTSGGRTSTTYTARVAYRYEIDGQVLVGDRVSYVEWGANNWEIAQETEAMFPLGAEVTAWVDPVDPEQAVLVPGVERFPFLVLLFLLPFHAVGLAGLTWRTPPRGDVARLLARITLYDDGVGRTVLRLPGLSPWFTGLIVFGCSSTVAALVLGVAGLFWTGSDLFLGVVGGLLGLALLVALPVWWFGRGPRRLVMFDDGGGQLLVGGLAEQDPGVAVVPYAAVRNVTVEEGAAASVVGDTLYRHRIAVLGEGPEPTYLPSFSGWKEDGERLAAWVRERVGSTRAVGEDEAGGG